MVSEGSGSSGSGSQGGASHLVETCSQGLSFTSSCALGHWTISEQDGSSMPKVAAFELCAQDAFLVRHSIIRDQE